MDIQDVAYEEYCTVSIPVSSKLTEDLIHQLDALFDFAAPGEYRETLIEMYHMYILHLHGDLPSGFDKMAEQICVLLEFLKVAETDLRNRESDSAR